MFGRQANRGEITPSENLILREMKNFAQIHGFWGVIGIRGHDITHMAPPLLAFGGLGDGLPPRLVLDLRVAKKLVRLGVKKDGVVVDSVFF